MVRYATSRIVAPIAQALGGSSKLALVGGTVRDLLLGLEPRDLDLATVLKPEEVASRLSAIGIRVIPTGIEHGTVTALSEGAPVEITTFRMPGPRSGARYSDSIEQDLAGRDFTINSIAFSIAEGVLVDPYGGVDDLSQRLVRAVGDPRERFEEDPLRVLRMVRFGPAHGWRVEPLTHGAGADRATLLSTVSVERIKSELEQILMSSDPSSGIAAIKELGALAIVLPEALSSIGFEQNEFHTEDVFEHTLSVLRRAAPDRLVRLAALFHDLGKPASLSIGEQGRRHFYQHEMISERLCEQAMTRLRFSHDDIAAVRLLVRLHMRPLDCGPAGIRRLIRDLGEQMDRWRCLKYADAPPKMAAAEFEQQMAAFDTMVRTELAKAVGSPFKSLALNGDDLKGMGVAPGPGLGEILRELHELVIETPELNTKERLRAEALRIIARGVQRR